MILCCGEALIDMLPRESAAGEPCFAPYAGGSVFNTAIALGRLGAPVQFFSGLSSDLFGDQLRSVLADSRVDARPAALSDRPTTLAFVTLTDGQARYAFYDENTAGRMLTPDDLPTIAGNVNALFFGGISLVVDPCADTYAHMMRAAAKDRVTMIDPNIRPGFIKDEPAYRTRLDGLLAVADIVKTSDEDLHWLMGPGDTADHAGALLQKGVKLVCLTEGAKGATGYFADGAVFVASEKADVVDTVGAGDTFNAGVLASLSEQGCLNKSALAALTEDQVAAALSLGGKSAAVTVARAGANPPWRHEL